MTEQIFSNERADSLLRCTAVEDTVRITLIDAANLVGHAQRVHALSRVATAALGRQLMMTAMMAADLKNDGDLVSTVIAGDGPAGKLICTGNAALDVKGTVTNGDVELPPAREGKLDVAGFVGTSGKIRVIRDLGLKEPYVGVSNLISGEIAMDFAEYYAASMQQPALVYLGVRLDASSAKVLSACGALVEPMPGCAGETLDCLEALNGQIARMSERAAQGETLFSLGEEIFAGLSYRVVGEKTPRYHCDCSRERVERALIATGRDELEEMIREDHGTEVCCRFCDKTYRFSEDDLRELIISAFAGGQNDRKER